MAFTVLLMIGDVDIHKYSSQQFRVLDNVKFLRVLKGIKKDPRGRRFGWNLSELSGEQLRDRVMSLIEGWSFVHGQVRPGLPTFVLTC